MLSSPHLVWDGTSIKQRVELTLVYTAVPIHANAVYSTPKSWLNFVMFHQSNSCFLTDITTEFSNHNLQMIIGFTVNWQTLSPNPQFGDDVTIHEMTMNTPLHDYNVSFFSFTDHNINLSNVPPYQPVIFRTNHNTHINGQVLHFLIPLPINMSIWWKQTNKIVAINNIHVQALL